MECSVRIANNLRSQLNHCSTIRHGWSKRAVWRWSVRIPFSELGKCVKIPILGSKSTAEFSANGMSPGRGHQWAILKWIKSATLLMLVRFCSPFTKIKNFHTQSMRFQLLWTQFFLVLFFNIFSINHSYQHQIEILKISTNSIVEMIDTDLTLGSTLLPFCVLTMRWMSKKSCVIR